MKYELPINKMLKSLANNTIFEFLWMNSFQTNPMANANMHVLQNEKFKCVLDI